MMQGSVDSVSRQHHSHQHNSASKQRRRYMGIGLLLVIVIVWLSWTVTHVGKVKGTLAVASDRSRFHPAHVGDRLGGNGADKSDPAQTGTAADAEIDDSAGDIYKKPPTTKKSNAPKTKRSTVVPVGDSEIHADGDAATVNSTTSLLRSPLFATLHTDYGLIHWELHPNEAPKTVDNIVRMARKGVFNDSCFYRYERAFVLQGGLHCNKRKTSTKGAKNVPLEYMLRNEKLTVSLARAGSDLNSGGTEFFINLANNARGLGPSKKGGYAVFATVIGENSIATMQALKRLPTKKSGLTRFVDPQPVIHFIAISDSSPLADAKVS